MVEEPAANRPWQPKILWKIKEKIHQLQLQKTHKKPNEKPLTLCGMQLWKFWCHQICHSQHQTAMGTLVYLDFLSLSPSKKSEVSGTEPQKSLVTTSTKWAQDPVITGGSWITPPSRACFTSVTQCNFRPFRKKNIPRIRSIYNQHCPSTHLPDMMSTNLRSWGLGHLESMASLPFFQRNEAPRRREAPPGVGSQ